MSRQITLLCLGAVLSTTYGYEHNPALEAYRKNEIWLRYDVPVQYLGDLKHGKGIQSIQALQHDSARKPTSFGNRANLQEAYTRKGPDFHKQGRKENNRRKLRNQLAKFVGRGFITDLVKEVAGNTAKITKGLLEGTVKAAQDVIQDSAQLTKDIIEGTVNVTKKAINWMTAKTIRIGKLIVEAPLQGIELTVDAAWAAHTFGVGLTAQILSDTAEWFEGNWQAVKAVEFPGKNLIVMLYPSGVMSVVNRLTKEIMYMIDTGHKMLTHGFAYTLYISLKIVFDSVNLLMKLSKLNCIKLTPQKIKVNEKLIDTVTTKSGKACGISHLKPVNNVTITRNDKKFLIVTTPWVLEDLSIHMTGVQAVGLGILGTVLDNEVMDTKIKRINATGTVSFQAGTMLRFVSIHLAIDSMEGLVVNFPGKKKSGWMEGIERMASDLSFLVTKEINHVFNELEKMTFDYIAHI